MSQDTLSLVLKRLDQKVEPIFGWDEVQQWPEGDLDSLANLGILRKIPYAKSIVCDGCEEGCVEKVVLIGGDTEKDTRGYIACQRRDDIGRVRVDLNRLKSWQISLPELAGILAELLGSAPDLKEIVDNRLWRIGSKHYGKNRSDLFLLVGSTWPDIDDVISEAKILITSTKPILFFPYEVPHHFPLSVGHRLSLADYFSLTDEKLTFDTDRIEEVVADTFSRRMRRVQSVVPIRTPSGTSWKDIEIFFTHQHTVRIEVNGQFMVRDFLEMGFVDNRKTTVIEPDKTWEHFLELAKNMGKRTGREDVTEEEARKLAIASDEQQLRVIKGSAKEFAKWKDYIADIRARLRAMFPDIKGNPIYYYEKQHAYLTAFKLDYSLDIGLPD